MCSYKRHEHTFLLAETSNIVRIAVDIITRKLLLLQCVLLSADDSHEKNLNHFTSSIYARLIAKISKFITFVSVEQTLIENSLSRNYIGVEFRYLP